MCVACGKQRARALGDQATLRVAVLAEGRLLLRVGLVATSVLFRLAVLFVVSNEPAGSFENSAGTLGDAETTHGDLAGPVHRRGSDGRSERAETTRQPWLPPTSISSELRRSRSDRRTTSQYLRVSEVEPRFGSTFGSWPPSSRPCGSQRHGTSGPRGRGRQSCPSRGPLTHAVVGVSEPSAGLIVFKRISLSFRSFGAHEVRNLVDHATDRAGVSSRTRDWRIFLRPRPASVAR